MTLVGHFQLQTNIAFLHVVFIIARGFYSGRAQFAPCEKQGEEKTADVFFIRLFTQFALTNSLTFSCKN